MALHEVVVQMGMISSISARPLLESKVAMCEN